MQTVLHMLCPFNVKFCSSSRAITFPGTLGSSLMDLGCCPGILGPFWLGWLWHCSSWIRWKANEPFSLQLARFVTCSHNCGYRKRKKPYDMINLGLSKERGRAQFKLQLITEAARGLEEPVCSYWDVGVCEWPCPASWSQLRSWNLSSSGTIPCVCDHAASRSFAGSCCATPTLAAGQG